MLLVKFKTFTISLKHIVVSHQVVGKTNRLGMLQMGIARHDRLHMIFLKSNKTPLRWASLSRTWPWLLLEIQVHICRNLVISNGSVCTSCKGTNFCQQHFHIHEYLRLRYQSQVGLPLALLRALSKACLDLFKTPSTQNAHWLNIWTWAKEPIRVRNLANFWSKDNTRF